MEMSWEMLLFIVAGGFFAAFVDSVVGGGGLIAVPVLLASGMPVAVVLGTNKLASTMSSLTSTISFLRSGKINISVVKRLFLLSVAGAVCGTLVLRQLSSDFLKPLVVVLLILITLYTIFKKSWGGQSTFQNMSGKSAGWMGIAAFGLGFYDGFFGPGTGSFLIFVFLMLGFDFVTAAGNAKVLNFGSNIASLATFAVLGSINYRVGIPMAVAMICGSWLGSRVAIRKGAAYVRPLFIIVCVILTCKQAWDLLQQ